MEVWRTRLANEQVSIEFQSTVNRRNHGMTVAGNVWPSGNQILILCSRATRSKCKASADG